MFRLFLMKTISEILSKLGTILSKLGTLNWHIMWAATQELHIESEWIDISIWQHLTCATYRASGMLYVQRFKKKLTRNGSASNFHIEIVTLKELVRKIISVLYDFPTEPSFTLHDNWITFSITIWLVWCASFLKGGGRSIHPFFIQLPKIDLYLSDFAWKSKWRSPMKSSSICV